MPHQRCPSTVLSQLKKFDKERATTEIFIEREWDVAFPMNRIAGQLAGEGKYCAKLTSFCWLNISPMHSNESATLYKDYQRWLHGL